MDCQTTGANPRQGSIIEIGWQRLDGAIAGGRAWPIATRIIRPKPAHEMPARVQRVTGIEPGAIAAGLDPADVWQEVALLARTIARKDGLRQCPAVVHFARFEAPFFHDLHARVFPADPFPLELICTHEMARRLLPHLPRRSIRAVAGYFGQPLADLRRARDHVAATAVIWRAAVRLLRQRHRVLTLAALEQWLAQPYKSGATARVYPMPDRATAGLPAKPGVYRMLGAAGDVLYVGKATSLRTRVRSYFRKGSRHAAHIMEMLSQARRIDFTVTPSALEAALEEADAIKEYDPPGNRSLRRAGRNLWFASADFLSFSEHPDTGYHIGPLAGRDAIAAAGAVRRLIQTGRLSMPDEDAALTGLGLPADRVPDLECVMDGYSLFHERHGARSRSLMPRRFIFELGRDIYSRKMAEQNVVSADALELELKQITVRSWTPVRVCATIESNIARAAHEMRLARWFLLLCESAFGWEERVGRDRRRFAIVLEQGRMRCSGVHLAVALPVPPGYGSTLPARQHALDLAAFDRLRILTTAMRQMVQRGHWVELRFGPDHTVDQEGLKKIFVMI